MSSTPSSPGHGGNYEKTIAELRNHNKELRAELKAFNATLETIKKQHEEALAKARDKSERTRTRTDGPLLGTPNANAGDEAVKALEAENKSSLAKIQILSKANKDLKKQLDSSAPDKVRKLRNDIAERDEIIRQHKVEISTLKQECKRMRTAAFTLETDDAKKKKEQDRMEIQMLKDKCAEYKRKADQTERNAVKQQEALVSAQQQIQVLSTKAEVKGRTAEEAALKDKVRRLKAELKELNEQRETERQTQAQIVVQFNRKIQVAEMTAAQLREQMKAGNLAEQPIKIETRRREGLGKMTKAQQLRMQRIKNNNPVLLEKLPGKT
jgi:chromosome segregation ATPase